MKFAVVLPTLNAAHFFREWISGLCSQTLQPTTVLVVDSSSEDATPEIARAAGFETVTIKREEFNHGATRQFAASLLPEMDVLVYLTQDAIFASPESLKYLLEAFHDSTVGGAYGRQLPRNSASPLESHARKFNYGPSSRIKSLHDRCDFGMKIIFISNSFAAYRRCALEQVGGFPKRVIMGEDTCVAAKMLLGNWKISYVAEAQVYHSHDYSYLQEFKRYFDTGVLHSREHWLLEAFGTASKEGMQFVRSEIAYLWRRHPLLIPEALLRAGLKLTGYKMGRLERYFSKGLKRKLSMHRGYWTVDNVAITHDC